MSAPSPAANTAAASEPPSRASSFDTATPARASILDNSSEVAPLGHYVLADILSRENKSKEAETEAAKGKALESRKKRPLDVG